MTTTQKVTYGVGDEINGVLQEFETLEEAQAYYTELEKDGERCDKELMDELGEDSEEWERKLEMDELNYPNGFFFIQEITKFYDEDGEEIEHLEQVENL